MTLFSFVSKTNVLERASDLRTGAGLDSLPALGRFLLLASHLIVRDPLLGHQLSLPLPLAVVLVPGGGKLEVLAAEVAGVGLLAGVSCQVSLQVVLLRELLAAVSALEGLLSSVKLLMSETVVPE